MDDLNKFDPFKFMKSKGGGNQTDEFVVKEYVLGFLTLKELQELYLEYISPEIPKVKYIENSITKHRVANRTDFIKSLSVKVPLECILETFPKLEAKLEE